MAGALGVSAGPKRFSGASTEVGNHAEEGAAAAAAGAASDALAEAAEEEEEDDDDDEAPSLESFGAIVERR